MTWAYKDKPDMTTKLAEEYTIAGNDSDALVISAGLAFARAVSKRPDLEFYQPDKRHPALIGTYLAASTIYSSIYKKSPVGNSYISSIDAKTANFLQSVAWETCVSPTVMKGAKSMKQAMKQVTNAEMNDLPPRRPIMR